MSALCRPESNVTLQIVIDFRLPTESFARNQIVHRIGNFGEDLYGEFKQSDLANIDLAEVDRATDQLCVRAVKSRKVRIVTTIITKMLERHNLAEIALVSQRKAG
jgi:hypothetical protein